MTFHSQCEEDKWIVENLPVPDKGIFIEVGAFDGIQSSNTYHFEQLGWTGLLVEPDRELAAKCLVNRQAQVFCGAVTFQTGYRRFFINDADRGLSGLEREGRETWTYGVALAHLRQMYNLPYVDLLSIDTEGTEVDVLQSCDFSLDPKYHPKIIIAEYSTLGLPSNEVKLIRELEEFDYKVRHKTLYNLIFTK